MQIWVDADACPGAIKDILFRAAERREVQLTLVANQFLRVPPSRWIEACKVASGFDVADNHIVRNVAPGDLVVTADVPLAAEVVERGALALNPRGTIYTAENVREKLATRDMMEELRSMREVGGGPAPLGAKDRQAFANALDRILTQTLR